MPGISYHLDLETEAFKQGAAQSMDYINQLHGRIDKLSTAGSGGSSFLKGLATTLFQLPQQVMALQGILNTLAIPSKLAASAETTAVAFRTLVGDTVKADAALAKVRKMAETTPFEFPELADGARKLLAFGESAENVATALRRIGDISSGVTAPIGEIAELYGKARVQGTLFAEDINQLTGRGIPIIQEFAKQLGVSQGEIKKLASDGKITFPMLEQAFIGLTSGAGKFAGMMDATSRTMEGRLSTLADSFKGLMVNVGEGLNEAIKPLVTDTSSQLDGLKDKAKSVGQALGSGIGNVKVAFDQGKIGELIFEAFKAGGLSVADSIVKAIDWGVQYMKAEFIQQSKSAPDDMKAKAAARQQQMMAEGLEFTNPNNGKSLGIDSLSKASQSASRELNLTIKNVSEIASINQAIARRGERDRQANSEQSRAAAAKREAMDKAGAELEQIADDNRNTQGPAVGQGGGIRGYQTQAEFDAARARRARMDALGLGGTAAAASASAAPALTGSGGSGISGINFDAGSNGLAAAGAPLDRRAGHGTHSIKGAGFRGIHGSTLSPDALGNATGRGAARQAKMAASASAENDRAKASNSGGQLEAIIRKMADNVERIAKAAEADGTI